jgi:hypothetical protein
MTAMLAGRPRAIGSLPMVTPSASSRPALSLVRATTCVILCLGGLMLVLVAVIALRFWLFGGSALRVAMWTALSAAV